MHADAVPMSPNPECAFAPRPAPVAVAIARVAMLASFVAAGGCASLPMPSLEKLKHLEIPANDPSFRSRVYVGAAFGNSHLDPDTSGTVFNVDDASALGTQLKLGVDMHNMLAFELETGVLGEASLREANTDVSYTAASVSALVYGFGGVQMRSRREGWSGFARLGYGTLTKSSQVVALDEGGTGAIVGLGGEYGFDNGLGIRAELTRYDSDAFFTGLGAIWRFGTPKQVGGALAATARTALGSEDTYVAEGGRGLETPADIGRRAGPRLGAASAAARTSGASGASGARGFRRNAGSGAFADGDGDGVGDASDACAATRPNTSVDERGCGLFDAVLGDVTFKPGSWWLNARARGALDDIATRLVAFPEVRIEVQAHTDSQGPADLNLDLSSRRAEAVVDYLRSRGVPELQLESLGVGETRPLGSNDTAPGRKRNRRVELVTLSDLPLDVLAGRDIEGSVWHYPTTVRAARALEDLAAAGPARSASVPVAPAAVVSTKNKPGVEPVPGAARARSVPAAPRVRPASLPRPGYLPGFRLGGVVEGLGFAPGSARLAPGGETALARIRAELERYPHARIAVMAHTDASGDAAANRRLSEQRARAVVDRLAALGVDPARMVAEGYGDSLPLVQGVTEDDRARNRRVEVRLLGRPSR